MAETRYEATRAVVIGGSPHEAGATFTAAPAAVEVALARGWVKEAREPKQSKPRPKRPSKAKSKQRNG
jgi:hypothetical protein